jgi:glycosyltransferase involved in cell wall biosynthesis
MSYGRTLLDEVERYARTSLGLLLGEAVLGEAVPAQSKPPESFDVIHAHDWMTFPAALLLKERTGKPLVVHFHSSESERRGPLASQEVRAIEQAAIDAAERVLCVSEASARALRSHYAVEYAKVRVLHNAFAPLDAARKTERAEPVVLYLGRLSEQKSPDVFLRAAARVAARHPRASFVLAGEGELYPELKALAEELGLSGSVRFTGFVSGEVLARTYAGADVYVLSSAAEPFGISALEALSLGVPTIVPRGAGVTEVVSSVLRFEPGDVADLAEKIVGLLERPALRSQLSAAGLREVKKLRWERPARALRGIYDELALATP